MVCDSKVAHAMQESKFTQQANSVVEQRPNGMQRSTAAER